MGSQINGVRVIDFRGSMSLTSLFNKFVPFFLCFLGFGTRSRAPFRGGAGHPSPQWGAQREQHWQFVPIALRNAALAAPLLCISQYPTSKGHGRFIEAFRAIYNFKTYMSAFSSKLELRCVGVKVVFLGGGQAPSGNKDSK